jgi:hypothetical protein
MRGASVKSELSTSEHTLESGSTDKVGILDRTSTVFLTALVVRLIVAAVFLGSVDTVNSLSFMPVAASHGYFYLPYFPIVENILGSSALLMNHLHFLPIGLFPKLLPCFADSLISVWLLRYNRFDATYRRRAAWIYAFCPLTIILVCLEGQWDSLWILPMLAALALSMQTRDGSPAKYRTCLIIGLFFGLALISKPVALVVAGLLIPNVHSRASLTSWIKELVLIATGAILSVAAFFVMFASEGIDLRRNLKGVISYGGSPGFIVFGPARLTFFHFLSHLQTRASVIGDFRTFAVIYVLGIVLYQVFSKTPMDTMAAAASMLLIAPAIGGLAAQYLVWPLAFLIAAGRLRIAVAYSAATSFLLLLYFLIPASSVEPGENIGAFLPLHSLRFLGIPRGLLQWAATTSFAHEVWLPILNLYLPIAMCALALYLLISKWRATPSDEALLLNPLELRATRACVPYAALLIVAVLTYSLEPTHVKKALIGVVQTGLTHYAFLRTIYSWSTWFRVLFWTVSTPYKDVQGGAWWGSIIVVGPILILLWSYLALRGQRVLVASSAHHVERSDRSTI